MRTRRGVVNGAKNSFVYLLAEFFYTLGWSRGKTSFFSIRVGGGQVNHGGCSSSSKGLQEYVGMDEKESHGNEKTQEIVFGIFGFHFLKFVEKLTLYFCLILLEMNQEPLEGCFVELVSQENVFAWRVFIEGPSGTP